MVGPIKHHRKPLLSTQQSGRNLTPISFNSNILKLLLTHKTFVVFGLKSISTIKTKGIFEWLKVNKTGNRESKN